MYISVRELRIDVSTTTTVKTYKKMHVFVAASRNATVIVVANLP